MITLALLAYVPFFDPLPIWVRPWLWSVLLVPLCLAVAIVYKCVRCRTARDVPGEATALFISILVGMRQQPRHF
jgi:hypothetical protein